MDFDIPIGLVSMFRGYSWTYENSMTKNTHEIINQTYTRKGLKRHCTDHHRNFKMIGKTSSFQSTGSMLAIPKEVYLHQCHRKNMHLLLEKCPVLQYNI